MYADDTQLYSSAKPDKLASLIVSIESCIEEVGGWMIANKLKMNYDKTEILFCSSRPGEISLNNNTIHINGDKMAVSQKAKNLGVFFLVMTCPWNKM